MLKFGSLMVKELKTHQEKNLEHFMKWQAEMKKSFLSDRRTAKAIFNKEIKLNECSYIILL